MENVYVVGIIAAAVAVVVIVVVWLLRDRITAGRISGSVPKKEFGAEIEAAPPIEKPDAPPPAELPPPEKPPSVDVTGNVMFGSGAIRVWRNSARAVKNKLFGSPEIDIRDQPQKSAPKSKKQKSHKKKKK